MKMEPFVAPDVSELSDRELLERTYLTMCYVQHFASQIGMAAQTHPLLKSIVPQP